MKKALVFVAKAVLGGLLIVVPIYLAILLLSVPFTEALKTISMWGSGAKDLVAAMERDGNPSK
jgi:hypothetical protein